MKKSGKTIDLGTRVLPCICRHDFQDVTYGSSKRLHNFARKKMQGGPAWVCTVCSKSKPFGGESPMPPKRED